MSPSAPGPPISWSRLSIRYAAARAGGWQPVDSIIPATSNASSASNPSLCVPCNLHHRQYCTPAPAPRDLGNPVGGRPSDVELDQRTETMLFSSRPGCSSAMV